MFANSVQPAQVTRIPGCPRFLAARPARVRRAAAPMRDAVPLLPRCNGNSHCQKQDRRQHQERDHAVPARERGQRAERDVHPERVPEPPGRGSVDVGAMVEGESCSSTSAAPPTACGEAGPPLRRHLRNASAVRWTAIANPYSKNRLTINGPGRSALIALEGMARRRAPRWSPVLAGSGTHANEADGAEAERTGASGSQ